jgi:sugar phosphate isomerase/epimerase
MYNRRNFLKHSGAFALGGLVFSKNAMASLSNNAAMHPVGLQLFTLFTTIDKDVPGTLKMVSDVGYKELESAFSMKGGFYGMTPKEFATLAKGNGLSWVSHHVVGAPFKMPPGGFKMPGADTTKPAPRMEMPPMKNLKENYQEIIDEVAAGGVKYLVCASIPLGKAAEIDEAVVILNKSGEAAKKAGLTLCYHNHIHEFDTVEGRVPYDVLLTQCSSDILKFELDLGWATLAGADPVALFNKNPGRFPLWHVKDINKETKMPVEIGKGMVDFKRIFAASKVSGMQHFFVEQDMAPSPQANITASFQYITTKILA